MTANITTKDSTVLPIIVPTNNMLKSVNFYLVKDADTLTLIDAGYNNDECWQAFNTVMVDNNLSITDLDQIILTHHHIDHIGLVNRILEKKDMPIYAHRKSIPRLKRDKAFLTMRAEFYERLYKEMGCGDDSSKYIERMKIFAEAEDGYVVNGKIIPLQDEIEDFQVIETPGHAVDHIVLLDKKRGWLFLGDMILSDTSTNALVEPDEEMNRLYTLRQYRKSLIECSKLEANVVFPGHQRLIYNHQELIRERLKRMDEKDVKLLEIIKNGVSTANELAIEFYRNKYKTQFPLVMSEIIGHLDYLEGEEKVYSKLVNGIRHYYIV